MGYLYFRKFFIFLFKLFNRFQVTGAENIPRAGPVILIANHVSYWDPFVMGAASPRIINYLAKESLFKVPVVSFFVKGWGAVPVKRGRTNRETIEQYLELLAQGHVLGIYIEGKRNLKNPDRMLPPQPGPVMLALRSKAPVVPMALINTRRTLWGFGKVKVAIGPPLVFNYESGLDKKELYRRIANQMVAAIMELKSQNSG